LQISADFEKCRLPKISKPKMGNLSFGVFVLLCLISCQISMAGPIHNRISKHRSNQQNISENISLPSGVKLIHDIPYGKDTKNRMDVYLPPHAKGAPVIFMVHGGAWRIGDKAAKAVVENKVGRWVTKGFIFISTNYRMLPTTDPLKQATDVARAIAVAQRMASSWGGDSFKFVLMGHSAGAHLVALLATSPSIALDHGVKPWLGTISIDTAVLDVVERMEARHFHFYDKVFGSDVVYWKSVSPFHLLRAAEAPFLAICSTRRKDSCSQAIKFVKKATLLGMRAKVLKINLSHKNLNKLLGKDHSYTKAVELFLATLDRSIKQALIKP